MKRSVKLISATVLSLLFAATSMAASPSSSSSETRLPLLQLAEEHGAQPEVTSVQEGQPFTETEDASPLAFHLGSSRFTFGGLIEAEATLVLMEGGEEEDDLRLSTFQLGLDAEITPWLSGRVIGLWEEEDTEPMVIDEAVVSLSPGWQIAGQTSALHIGRQYLPFGRFDSSMISDPHTLDLGETQTSAILWTMEGGRWNSTLGAFVGSTDRDDSKSLDTWVAAIEATPYDGISFGTSWISDLAESGAGLVRDENLYREDVPGWSAFLAIHHGGFGLTAEYLTALKRFKEEMTAIGEDLSGPRPKAWNLDVTWQATEKMGLAARYEESDGYQADLRRFGATTSYALCDAIVLAAEYLHSKTGNGETAHDLTAKLALEF